MFNFTKHFFVANFVSFIASFLAKSLIPLLIIKSRLLLHVLNSHLEALVNLFPVNAVLLVEDKIGLKELLWS
jgi:hypothetical protein